MTSKIYNYISIFQNVRGVNKIESVKNSFYIKSSSVLFFVKHVS